MKFVNFAMFFSYKCYNNNYLFYQMQFIIHCQKKHQKGKQKLLVWIVRCEVQKDNFIFDRRREFTFSFLKYLFLVEAHS